MNEREPRLHLLFDAATIARRTEELAEAIAQRLPPEFTLVVLLKGAFVFAADLVRALDRRGLRPESSSSTSRPTVSAPRAAVP